MSSLDRQVENANRVSKNKQLLELSNTIVVDEADDKQLTSARGNILLKECSCLAIFNVWLCDSLSLALCPPPWGFMT